MKKLLLLAMALWPIPILAQTNATPVPPAPVLFGLTLGDINQIMVSLAVLIGIIGRILAAIKSGHKVLPAVVSGVAVPKETTP